jgi:RNA polymerase sigma factor (sigma-70 family)
MDFLSNYYEGHWGKLCRFARRQCHGWCPESAEDVVQDAFLIVLRRWDAARYNGLDEEAQNRALMKFTRRTILNIAMRKCRDANSDLKKRIGAANDSRKQQVDPVDELIECEISERIQIEQSKLREDERQALRLCYAEGISFRRIAEVMGLPSPYKAKVLVIRAIDKLRDKLS